MTMKLKTKISFGEKKISKKDFFFWERKIKKNNSQKFSRKKVSKSEMKKPAEFDLCLCIKMCVGEEDGWAMCLSVFRSYWNILLLYIKELTRTCSTLVFGSKIFPRFLFNTIDVKTEWKDYRQNWHRKKGAKLISTFRGWYRFFFSFVTDNYCDDYNY